MINTIGKLLKGLIHYIRLKSPPSSIISHPSSKKSFTLMELLIVVSVIALLAVASLAFLDPKKSLERSWDAQRKHDLTALSKALENYYNDHECYPSETELCYQAHSDGTFTCPICGKHANSPSFAPYLSRLPCDPAHPIQNYLYQTLGSHCPQWYRIYTKLKNLDDSAITQLGCQNGCGPPNPPYPTPAFGFNFGVSSQNTIIEKPGNLDSCPGCATCGTRISCFVNKICNNAVSDFGICDDGVYYLNNSACTIRCSP